MASASHRDLVTDIERMIENLGPSISRDCCIYRVPHKLRKVMNEDAYTPYAVSIGPIHHGRKGLELTEKEKLRFLNNFICLTEISLDRLVFTIKHMECKIRRCYGETFVISSDEFVKMILTDATFIILLFLRYLYGVLDPDPEYEFVFDV